MAQSFRNRPRSRLLTAGALVAATSLLVSGCTGGGDDGSDGDAQTGGTLMVAITQDSGCQDPWQTTLTTQLEYQRQMVDSLVYQGRDGEYTPWLATSWEINPEVTEFTFHLRDDVTFTDGSPFNAETVKANFDAMQALGGAAPTPSNYLGNYIGTDVIDDTTAVVKFSEPNAPFLYGVSLPNLAMYSTESASLDAAARCAAEGITSGPFVFSSYSPNERIELVKNPDYQWGPEALPNTGPAYLDGVTYNIVTDSSALTNGLLANDLQIAFGIADQGLDQVMNAGMEYIQDPTAGSAWSFILNLNKGNIGDVAVRQAMNIAIDRTTLMTTQPFSQSAAKDVFATTHPYFVDRSSELAYDPEKAGEILDEAGWIPGSDGIREKDGQRLVVDVIYYQTAISFTSMMELIKQQLAEVGIELTLTPVTPNEERQRRTEGNFETRLSKFSGADPVILNQLVSGFDARVDELLSEAGTTADLDDRKTVVTELTEYIIEQGYVIPVYDQLPSAWWRPELKDLIFDLGDRSMLAQVQMGS